jgi:hypothetical protein
MHGFDQLDWVHQWDQFEMVMYVDQDETGADCIHMQVLAKQEDEGAEVWDILYDRIVTTIDYSVDATLHTDAWQDQVLRHYLNTHPTLVPDEKEKVAAWMREEWNPDAEQ